jgi:hypothetical protein
VVNVLGDVLERMISHICQFAENSISKVIVAIVVKER